MKFSAVIAIYNRTRYLDKLLATLRDQYNDMEIVLVDDGSANSSEIELFSQRYNTTFINHEENLGLSAAKNTGIRNSTGEVTVFLDDDLLPKDGWKEIFEEEIAKGFAIVGGVIEPWYEVKKPFWMNKALDFVLALNHNSMVLLEGATAIKKEVFDKAGFFNEKLGRRAANHQAGEGWELYKKAQSQGYKIKVVEKAIFQHIIPASKTKFSYFCKRSFAEGYSDALAKKAASRSFAFSMRIIKILPYFFVNFPLLIIYVIGAIWQKIDSFHNA